MFDVRKRLYSLVPAILAALLQHTIQESTHYVAARLLVIAWAPAIVTTLIGCALYRAHDRWLASVPLLNAGLWFSMAYFLVVDPLYFAVLSSFFGGGDVAAAAAVGWPRWPVHVLAGRRDPNSSSKPCLSGTFLSKMTSLRQAASRNSHKRHFTDSQLPTSAGKQRRESEHRGGQKYPTGYPPVSPWANMR